MLSNLVLVKQNVRCELQHSTEFDKIRHGNPAEFDKMPEGVRRPDHPSVHGLPKQTLMAFETADIPRIVNLSAASGQHDRPGSAGPAKREAEAAL